jgi:hypothetical protein
MEVLMLKTVLLGFAGVLVVAVVGLLIVAATKPDSFRVQRSASIKASPEKIFAQINDLRAHGAWSPWERKDPGMKRIYRGPQAGKGAIYEWDGNKEIGQGRMEIAEAVAPSKVTMKLDFIRPFEAHNVAEFVLQPAGDSTTVTWAIYGPSPYISKLMTMFFDMDKMIGPDFEKGLDRLKAEVEGSPAAQAGIRPEDLIVELDGGLYLTLTRNVRARAYLENIFGARYYPTAHSNNNISPGSPRAVRVSVISAF